MRILLLNHYYWPDISANAQYGTQLAEDLVAAGMEVHTIASKGDYLGKRKQPLKSSEIRNGVSIHRVPVTNFGKKTALRRIGDAVSFHLMSFFVAMRIPKPDVIITQTAPLLIVTNACVITWLRRSKLLIWCQDVWPDIAFALHLFREKSYSGRIFRYLSYRSMRRADIVAAIGRCMEKYLKNGVGLSHSRIVIHPNWGDNKAIVPVPSHENRFREKHRLNGKFIVMYSGNMGWGHPFDSIMDAVRQLQYNSSIHFLFIGDGQRRPFIEEYIETHLLRNITLLPYQPYEDLAQSLSSGDIHLVSLDERLDGLIIPSKFYGILAVGKPVVFLGSETNEIAYVIKETGCGVRLSSTDSYQLVEILLDAANNREQWEEKGERGFSAFQIKYKREIGTGRYIEALRNMTNN